MAQLLPRPPRRPSPWPRLLGYFHLRAAATALPSRPFPVSCRNFSLTPWEAAVPPYQYRQEVPYFDILVPTVDTTRYGALLNCLLAVNRSVLITGPGGTGKSALVRSVLNKQQVGLNSQVRHPPAALHIYAFRPLNV
jgi:hypothetical protein